jgi:hypothetical protein
MDAATVDCVLQVVDALRAADGIDQVRPVSVVETTNAGR